MEQAKANTEALTALHNAYPAIAAELREARERVRELEAEIEVRDNSANETLRILREALPNRGFHSEMEAAEAAKEEIRQLEQANGDLRRERDRAVEEAKRQDGVAKGLRAQLDAVYQDLATIKTCTELPAITIPRPDYIANLQQQLAAATERAEKAEREREEEGEGWSSWPPPNPKHGMEIIAASNGEGVTPLQCVHDEETGEFSWFVYGGIDDATDWGWAVWRPFPKYVQGRTSTIDWKFRAEAIEDERDHFADAGKKVEGEGE